MMFKRNADRKNLSAWYGWNADAPEAGSHLLILPDDATERTASELAFELIGLGDEHRGEDPFDFVIVRLAWISQGEMLTIFNPKDGTRVEMRERTIVENDLLEELTCYLKVAAGEEE